MLLNVFCFIQPIVKAIEIIEFDMADDIIFQVLDLSNVLGLPNQESYVTYYVPKDFAFSRNSIAESVIFFSAFTCLLYAIVRLS